jgi:hypothetical protein
MSNEQAPSAPAAGLRASLPLRLRAAGIHFSLSLAVFAVALYLILVRWYPGFHFGVDGGWQGVRIMVAVDLVLGPALTLVIFNPFKARRLIVFDLACIGLLQTAALAWGFYAVQGQQPVSINWHDGIFYSVPARSLRAEPEGEAVLRNLGGARPALVYVEPPRDEAGRSRQSARMAAGLMVHEDPQAFRPLAPHWPEVSRQALDPSASSDPAFRRDLARFLEDRGGAAADYRFFRYQGGYGSCMLVFDGAGEPLGALGCEAQ